MDPRLREAWTSVVTAADYDRHMAAVGQAQANAELLEAALREQPPSPGKRLLVAGAGTGQILDYLPPTLLGAYAVTFTDINADYLSRLSARARSAPGLTFETVVDDVEESRLSPGFELVVAILVLEHVDWRRAIATLCHLSSARVLVVLQENPPHLSAAMTRSPQTSGSMSVFSEVHPHLLAKGEVESEFRTHGFALRAVRARDVADGKKMIALELDRATA